MKENVMILRVMFLFGVALAAGCAGFGTGMKSGNVDPSPSPSASISPSPTPLPSTGVILTRYPVLNLTGTVNASAAEITRLSSAATLANKVLAGPCFAKEVLAASYTETNGLTQKQILERISKTSTDIEVEIFNGSFRENHWWHTIAYEGTGSQISLNRYFLGDASAIAQTFVHEGLGHRYGFRHEGWKDTSVPYGLQYAVEKCATVVK